MPALGIGQAKPEDVAHLEELLGRPFTSLNTAEVIIWSS